MDTSRLLGGIPSGLRSTLIDSLSEICRNYSERRWEPSELNGGKLCEAVYCVAHGVLSGTFPAIASKPANMVDACRDLERNYPPVPGRVGDRSLRILIPRLILGIYEFRSNRGVGHVGSDVDPNFMDATLVHGMSKWLVAELIRIFHQVTTYDAELAVNALVERKLPIIWERDGIRRVLVVGLDYADETLLLLYSTPNWTAASDLVNWTEHSNGTVYRRTVLTRLHDDRLIEFDAKQDRACITPAGIRVVESRLLPKVSEDPV